MAFLCAEHGAIRALRGVLSLPLAALSKGSRRPRSGYYKVVMTC